MGYSYMYKTKNKYHNNKVEYKGVAFDSKKELRFFLYLKDLEQSGIVREVKRQVKYTLQPAFKHNNKTIRAITYNADFTCVVCDVQRFKKAINKDVYVKKGDKAIIDTKGFKTEVYKIKKKLMQYKGYDIIEI